MQIATMKKVLVGIILFISAVSAFSAAVRVFADANFDEKAWRALQRYDVRTLSKNFESHVGQLVEVHFNFRGKDIHHLKPNWYESSIWQPDPQGRKGFSSVRVMVAKGDLKAFKSLPTDSASPTDITVYGKVRRDAEANFVFVRLIGRNTIIDPAGNVNVSW